MRDPSRLTSKGQAPGSRTDTCPPAPDALGERPTPVDGTTVAAQGCELLQALSSGGTAGLSFSPATEQVNANLRGPSQSGYNEIVVILRKP